MTRAIAEPEPKLPSPADDQPEHAPRLREPVRFARLVQVNPQHAYLTNFVERRDDVLMRGLLNADWNTPSIRFYKRLGASLRKEWILTRLSGPALRRLAARSSTE